MAFGELGFAKTIAMNAPKKIKKIVEPFADMGTVALFPGMKKPKQHIINIIDETIYQLMLFIQGLTGADKKKLKSFDWVSSEETFNTVLGITATEGAELYYRYFYLKKFGVKAADPEQPPTYDFLSAGNSLAGMLFTLPVTKVGIKKATITNDDPGAVISSASGADTFVVLLPMTPEQTQDVESKLPGLSASYFYAKKSASNEELFDSAGSAGDTVVSTFAASSIMMATMEVRTNYDHKSANKLKVVDPAVVTP